jgi:tetraacyldisaccharide 4'-kinase
MSRVDEWLAQAGAANLLYPAAKVYERLMALRNALYDRGVLRAARLGVPVVSIGNLTAGGTGKTPMAAWCVAELRRRNLRPGVLSRGYARRGKERGDEAELFARLLPDVPYVEDKDRLRGGQALEGRQVDVVVLDDGFQHRALARDLDIVLVDATRPFGLPPLREGAPPVRACLPRGLLRENVRGIARANVLVITRSDQVEPGALDALCEEMAEIAPQLPIALSAHRPCGLRDLAGSMLDPTSLRGREVDVVSGIGNPEAFEASLRGMGALLRVCRRLKDHHRYVERDLAGLGLDGRWVVTTEKDASKLPPVDVPVVVLAVEMEILRGESVLCALLDSLPVGSSTAQRRSLHEGLHG